MNLFEFANERESIRLLREAGVQEPWTKDERLHRLHFGNVFSEDDPTTQWIQEHMIHPDRMSRRVVFAACVARMFGTVEALEQIAGLTSVDEIFKTLEPTYGRRKKWMFTGRYHLKPRPGSTRMATVKQALLMDVHRLADHTVQSNLHVALCCLPGVGPICANEILADLHGTCMFPIGSPDEYVFPHWGVMAGLGLDTRRNVTLSHTHPRVLEAQAVLCDTLEQSRSEWRYPDRPWTITTAARAALLYGQYLNGDYSRKRSR